MTAIPEVYVWCDFTYPDGKQCDSSIHGQGFRTATEARTYLHRMNGWGVNRAGGKDYCQAHATVKRRRNVTETGYDDPQFITGR